MQDQASMQQTVPGVAAWLTQPLTCLKVRASTNNSRAPAAVPSQQLTLSTNFPLHLQDLEPVLLQAAAAAQTPDAGAAAAATPAAASLSELLSLLQPASGNGPCTAVWTSGTIAYRCKTCAVSNSSAVRSSMLQPLTVGVWQQRGLGSSQ